MRDYAARTNVTVAWVACHRIEVWDKVGPSHYHPDILSSGLGYQEPDITLGITYNGVRCGQRPTRAQAFACIKGDQQNTAHMTSLHWLSDPAWG